jgi:Spy/CpxP family protein refolding chaperone
MKKLSFVAVLSTLAVFCSGVTLGALGYRLYSAPTVATVAPAKLSPEEWRKKFLGEMQTRLNLDANQTSQLNTILDETRKQFDEARKRGREEMKKIHLGQVDRVRAMLTDAQRPEYEKILEERDKRMKQEKRRPSGF